MTFHPERNRERMAENEYLGRFAVLLVLVFCLAGIFLFLALRIALAQPLPGNYSGVYFALVNMSSFMAPLLFFSMTSYVLLVSLAIVVLCGYTLHKIAGPLYRIERTMQNYESGDSVRAVFLREGDQLVALADAYNDFVARLREDRRNSLAAMEHAERFCLMDPATCRAEMEKALIRLSDLLSRYR